MKLLSLTEKIKLTKQQELEFIDVLEDDIKKYFRIPIFFIMLFQIYNMVYVSVYTDFIHKGICEGEKQFYICRRK